MSERAKGAWARQKNDWHFGEMASDGSGGGDGGCLNIPRINVKWLNANGIKLCRLTLDHILWSFSSFGWVNPFRFGWLVGRSVRLKCDDDCVEKENDRI